MTTGAARLVTCLAAANACAFGAGWQKLDPLPEPNGGLASGVVHGKIIVVGGTNWVGGAKRWLTTAYCLDPATLHWNSLGSLPQPVAYALVATIREDFVVVGGTTGTAPFHGMIRVGPDGIVRSVPRGLSVPAVISAGGMIGDELIVVGGSDDAANVKGLRDQVFAWNPQTNQLRILPAYPGGAIGTPASVVMGGELLVFGGCIWNPKAESSVQNIPDACAFSSARNAWRRMRPLPYAVRGLAAVALDERRIYLGGGFRSPAEGMTDRAFVYDIVADSYSPAAPLPDRAAVALVSCNGFIYCLGGEDLPKHRTAEVYRIRVSELLRN